MNGSVNWKRNLWAVWLSQYLSLAGFGMCGPFIPLFIKDSLGVTDDAVRGVFVSAFTFVGLTSLCLANIVWGMVADRYGRKLMLLRASFGTAFFYPLMACSPNVYWLIAIRGMAALFTGTVNPAQTLLVSTAPPERHGYVLGVLSTAVWSGNMTGYLLGGVVVEIWGYTAAFLSCSFLYFISGLLIQFAVQEDFHPPQKNKAGGAKPSLRKELLAPGVIAVLVMFLLMGGGRRIDQPFVAMLVELIHGPQGAACCTGIISAVSAVGGVVTGFCIGALCDRYPPEKMLLPSVLLAGVAAALQGFAPNVWMLGAGRFVAYFVGGGLQPILLMMLSRLTPPEHKGTFFGWSASINQAGGIVGSVVSGVIVYNLGVRAIFFAGALILAFMLIPGWCFIRPGGISTVKENRNNAAPNTQK